MTKGITQKAFAQQINKAAGYVTQLKNAGRLVLDEKGKVLAEASIKRIEETADPSKVGVVKRHAEAREPQAAEEIQEIEPPGNAEGDESFNYWKTKNEKLKFESAHRESLVRDGELLEVADVIAELMDANTIVRNRLEALPDILAPQIAAETDEHQVMIIVRDRVDFALSGLVVDFKQKSNK